MFHHRYVVYLIIQIVRVNDLILTRMNEIAYFFEDIYNSLSTHFPILRFVFNLGPIVAVFVGCKG
jgi:hypothetical protein